MEKTQRGVVFTKAPGNEFNGEEVHDFIENLLADADAGFRCRITSQEDKVSVLPIDDADTSFDADEMYDYLVNEFGAIDEAPVVSVEII